MSLIEALLAAGQNFQLTVRLPAAGLTRDLFLQAGVLTLKRGTLYAEAKKQNNPFPGLA